MEDELIKRDLSEKIGRFRCVQLVYFGNLKALNISHCTFLNASAFVDCIQACSQLTELRFVNCTQFHENQIVKMLVGLAKLEICDGSATRDMLYVNTYTIVTTLRNLRLISLQPCFPKIERNDWEWLVKTFKKRVKFGHAIMVIFPNSGRHLIIPSSSDSEFDSSEY